MKKYVKYLGLFCLLFLLTGCYRIKTNMKINDDKSMDFEMVYALDKTALESTGFTETEGETNDGEESEISKDDFKKLEDLGFKLEEYSEKENDHEWAGVKIKKHYDNIDAVTKETEKEVVIVNGQDSEDFTFDDSQYFSKKDGVYKATIVFDFAGEETEKKLEETNPDEDDMDMTALANMLDLTYSVTLPDKPVSNNATSFSEDGKTLTWKLDISKKNVITYEFKDFGIANVGGASGLTGGIDFKMIGIAVAAVLVVVIVIVVITSKKKKEETAPVAPAETTVAPVEPVANPTVEPTTPVETTPVETTPVEPVVNTDVTTTEPVTPVVETNVEPTMEPTVEPEPTPVEAPVETQAETTPTEPTTSEPKDTNNLNN